MIKFEMDEALLVELYQQGLNSREIAKKFGCSRETVRRRLNSLGVKMRPSRQYQFKYDIRTEAFSSINDEESAYWLGFMFADGYVTKDRRTFGMNLAMVDQGHLNAFRSWLGYSGPLLRANKKFPQSVLKITRPVIAESLIAHGCVPQKTGITQPPIGVPADLNRHFIRGLFDGDGSLSIGFRRGGPRLSISILGDIEILNWIVEMYPGNFAKPRKTSANIYLISMDGACKPEGFLDWIYRDSHVRLDRKYRKYLSWKGRNEIVNSK